MTQIHLDLIQVFSRAQICFPANIYLLKFNNRNTRNTLVFLLLTLNKQMLPGLFSMTQCSLLSY